MTNFAWCAWKVGPGGRPIVLATCYAPDLPSAKAHFGERGPSIAVTSRAALREMGRLPVPEQPDRYGRPARTGGVGPRKAGCAAERVDFRQPRFA